MTKGRLSMEEIKQAKDQAAAEVKAILTKVEQDYPGLIEGLGTAVGAASGGAASIFALSSLGTAGLSGAGITSGLATAGGIVGGGMVAGISVLAAPVAVLAVGGFWFAAKRRKAKLAAALGVAISKLYAVQTRLIENAEYFKEEIAGIKVAIDMLNRKNPSAAFAATK